jgi:hypothetical protein
LTRGKETTSGGPGRLLLLGVGLVLLVAGCDSGPKRCHVSGQVLYEGKPVPAGEIYFDPDFTKGHDGPQGFARIKDGRYDTREIGKPLAAGPHVVRVLGCDGKIPPGEDLPFGRPLFAEYKQSVDIPAQENATVDIDVPVRGPGK